MTGKTEKKESSGQADFILVAIILSLLLFGFIMLLSASSPGAAGSGIFRFIVRQGGLLLIGVAALFFSATQDYHMYRKLTRLLFGSTLALMVIVPIVGFASHGATRQISLGFISFQPSELAKFVLVIYFAGRFTRKETQNLTTDYRNIWTSLGVIGLFCATCFLQSHMSAAIVLAVISVLMMMVAGFNVETKWKIIGIISAIVVAALFILTEEYRKNRILALFDPFKYKRGIGWQIVQSLYAVGSGGLFGLGLGQSRQKFNYLPEAQNDYIFAVICEELGFIGGMVVILLFVLLFWRGMSIALNAKDKYGMYIAFGITSIIGIQMLINIGVVLSVLPSTGMQLPLFSSGGTSLIVTMWGLGILVNISKNSKIKKL